MELSSIRRCFIAHRESNANTYSANTVLQFSLQPTHPYGVRHYLVSITTTKIPFQSTHPYGVRHR